MAKKRVVLPVADRTKIEKAREFRKNPTKAEAEAWELLRNRQIFGLKFRRQKTICGFIVDFYCAEHGLILEIDGGVHEEAAARVADAERTEILRSAGLTVVRIPNRLVNREYLAKQVRDFLKKR